jgi:hypothetical protein
MVTAKQHLDACDGLCLTCAYISWRGWVVARVFGRITSELSCSRAPGRAAAASTPPSQARPCTQARRCSSAMDVAYRGRFREPVWRLVHVCSCSSMLRAQELCRIEPRNVSVAPIHPLPAAETNDFFTPSARESLKPYNILIC